MTDPFVRSFWADLGQRLVGQARQVIAPVVASAALMTGTLDLQATGAVLGAALLLTLIKATLVAATGITVPPGAPWWRVAIDRALPAAAGVTVGYVPTSLTGIDAVNWAAVGAASAGAAVLALLDYRHATVVTARKAAAAHAAKHREES